MAYLPTPCPAVSHRLALESIDDFQGWSLDYFQHVIGCYPKWQHAGLMAMFQENEHVIIQPDLLISTHNAYARTRVETHINDRSGHFWEEWLLDIDQHIHESPLVEAQIKIHEIGVHMGQIPHGYDGFDRGGKTYKKIDFDAYTELSAAACEYHFIRPIKKSVLDEQIALLPDPELKDGRHIMLQDAVREDYDFILTHPMEDYLDRRSDNFYQLEPKAINDFKDYYHKLTKSRDSFLWKTRLKVFGR